LRGKEKRSKVTDLQSGQNMRGLGWFRGFGMLYGSALGPTD